MNNSSTILNLLIVDMRYEVPLPWRSTHLNISLNYQLSLNRLNSLLRKLRQDSQLLTEYDKVMQEQLKNGIIEVVIGGELPSGDRIHYLLHHAVMRRDRQTTKLGSCI